MLLISAAWALHLDVRATVSADLTGVEGEVIADEPVAWVNALARLPVPPDDLTRLRSFPRNVDAGSLTWTVVGPGHLRFKTRLPHRYGDVGALPGRGLWANGAWLPQPVDADGRPQIATWTVAVAVPADTLGILNGTLGAPEVRWEGTSDRAALAVVARPVVTDVAPGVRLVESRRHRRHLGKELARLAAAWDGRPVVFVEDRDFNRLARPAPGMVYLSDQAFRVVPGVNAFHRDPVWRAMTAAAFPAPDGWLRDFAGAAVGKAPRSGDVKKTFGWLAWNPVVDAILNDGTTPFYSDLFAEPFAEHPSALDAMDDRIPGRAAAAQVDTLLGAGGAQSVIDAGDPRRSDAIPEAIRQGWAAAYVRDQDYVVGPEGVVRHAPDTAPVEVVSVSTKAGDTTWLAEPGDLFLTDGPARVRGAVEQDRSSNDSWPPRWSIVASGSIDDINPNQHTFSAWGALTLRRQGDNRNVIIGSLEHDDQDLVSANVGYVRYLGRLLNRQQRQHRLYVSSTLSLLDPAFRPTDDGSFALGASVSYTWNTKGPSEAAVRGHSLGVWASGGFIPGSEERWGATGASAVGLFPVSLREVVALRVKGGVATGDVEHRLLTLGGSADVRAVPSNAGLGNMRVVGSAEIRWTPLHHLDLPLGFAWLTELRLVPGLDVGRSWRDDTQAAAAGANLGLYWNLDNLGQLPAMSGVAVAVPIWATGVQTEGVQWYIEFAHTF